MVAKLPARAVIFKKTPNEPVPFGHGRKPWLQVLAIWILFADSWGLPSANGTFQTYYTQNSPSDYNDATVAWIGSVQRKSCTLGCLQSGILLDRGYLQSLIAVGSVL